MPASVCVAVLMCEILRSTQKKRKNKTKQIDAGNGKTLLPLFLDSIIRCVCAHISLSSLSVYSCAVLLYIFVCALNFTFIESNDFIFVLIYEYYY